MKMTKKKDPKDIKKAGRPENITPEIADRLMALFKMGLNDGEVCEILDIPPSVLYAHQARHPEFLEKKLLSKKHLVSKSRLVVYNGLNSLDEKLRVDTAKWILERKAKAEFSTRQEVTGADGESIKPVNITIIPVSTEGK